ncbi:MAG: hypothetical protein WBL80_05635, partial [Erysipelotrichaceae bacterium]
VMPYKRKFDFVNLWEGGIACDAERYTKEEALKIYESEVWEPTDDPSCTLKWARSEVGIDDGGSPSHAYIIHDEQVKRSFKVWEVR